VQARSDDELVALLPRIAVVARARPADKSRLVRIGQRAGMVVGMTGDGVNDSAALKKARPPPNPICSRHASAC
jgi:magnesium-transporting ATPase (P-type)